MGLLRVLVPSRPLNRLFSVILSLLINITKNGPTRGEIRLGGQRVVVVEDLISTGGSSLKAVEAIREAGFEPQLRNQKYEWRELPQVIEEQVIDY